jgi:hypothetical protein
MLTDTTGAWEMLGSLVNGGTLYLRGSDWNATLEQVSSCILPKKTVH